MADNVSEKWNCIGENRRLYFYLFIFSAISVLRWSFSKKYHTHSIKSSEYFRISKEMKISLSKYKYFMHDIDNEDWNCNYLYLQMKWCIIIIIILCIKLWIIFTY